MEIYASTVAYLFKFFLLTDVLTVMSVMSQSI